MNIQHPFYILGAEAYGVGTYDCGKFEEGCAAGASTGNNEGGLSYTGYNVLIPVALAAALIIAAAILLITRMVRKRKAAKA